MPMLCWRPWPLGPAPCLVCPAGVERATIAASPRGRAAEPSRRPPGPAVEVGVWARQAWADGDLQSLARAAALREARASCSLRSAGRCDAVSGRGFVPNGSERVAVVAASLPELLSKLPEAVSCPTAKGRRVALLLSATGREAGAWATRRLLQAMIGEEKWPALQRMEELEVQTQCGAAFASLLGAASCVLEDLGALVLAVSAFGPRLQTACRSGAAADFRPWSGGRGGGPCGGWCPAAKRRLDDVELKCLQVANRLTLR